MVKIYGVFGPSVKEVVAEKLSRRLASAFGFGKSSLLKADGCGMGVISVMKGDSFTASRKGLHVVFSGRIHDLPQKYEGDAARYFIDEFSNDKGMDFLKRVNGNFSVAIYDSKDGAGYLAVDRCGFNPVYYTVSGNNVFFGSELKALASVMEKKSVNWDYWRDFFAYGYGLGSKTPLRDVYSVEGGSFVKFKAAKTVVRRYWSFDSIKVKKSSATALMSAGDIVLRNVFSRACIDIDSCTVPLSGGYDSRCIIAGIKKFTKTKPVSKTMAKIFPAARAPEGDMDSRFGKLVAERLGVPFEIYGNQEDYYKNNFLRHVWLMEGMSYENMWVLPFSERIDGGFIFDGIAGDVFLKAGYLTRPDGKCDLSRPSVVEKMNDLELAGKIHWKLMDMSEFDGGSAIRFFKGMTAKQLQFSSESVVDELRQCSRGHNRLKIFQVRNRTKNAIALAQSNVLSRKGNVVMPFCDNEFMEFALSVPLELKAERDVYGSILQNSFPEIRDIPTNSDFGRLNDKLKLYMRSAGLESAVSFARGVKRRVLPSRKSSHWNRRLSGNPLDVEFLIKLAGSVEFPEFIDKRALISKVEADVARDVDPSPYLEPLLYFVVWHNLFIDGKNINLDNRKKGERVIL